MLRFLRKANLAQKVLRVDPTMVSLPLDARRTKRPWSFDRFACLTFNFAPARRLSREMHCWRRQGQDKRLRPTVKCAPARRPSVQMSFRYVEMYLYAMPADPNAFLCVFARLAHFNVLMLCFNSKRRSAHGKFKWWPGMASDGQ